MTLPHLQFVMHDAVHPDPKHHKIDPPANKHKSKYPTTPMYLPTSENIEKLKQLFKTWHPI